jgi:hypothetical protein
VARALRFASLTAGNWNDSDDFPSATPLRVEEEIAARVGFVSLLGPVAQMLHEQFGHVERCLAVVALRSAMAVAIGDLSIP